MSAKELFSHPFYADHELSTLAIASDANLKAYYRFESGQTLTDSSGNSNTLTAIATPTFGAGKFGDSVTYASASSQAHSIADHSTLKPTGNFTVGAWIKTSTVGRYIFQSYSQNTAVAGISLTIDGSGFIQATSGKNTGTVANTDFKQVSGTVACNDNAWHFAAMTWDGSTLKVYVDGKLDASASWANAAAYAATNYVRIAAGNSTGTNGSFFNGSLDDVFLLNGTALTQAQINTIHTGLYSYYRFNSGALTTDTRGSRTLTNNNTVGETASGKFGYSADFGTPNTNKSFSRDDTYGISSWATPFSISCWAKRYAEISSGEHPIFAKEVESTTGGINYVSYQYNSGTRRLRFARYDEATAENAYINMDLGTDWVHIVFVYDGTNIIPYANGVAGTPVASDGSSAGTSYQNDLIIGTDGGGTYWPGYIDDFAVFPRALTAAEVLSLYNLKTSGMFLVF